MDFEDRHIEILIPPKKGKERLDSFLAMALPQVSRSQVQKLIKEGAVTLDGQSVKARHLVMPGNRIQVTLPRPVPQDVIPENIPLNIVYEDEFLLIVNKAAGMVVHPAVGNPCGTLVNALLYHCNHLSRVNDATRPGIVHRIDKDTSGLLVVAKEDETHSKLALQFSAKSVHRRYNALLWGKFKKSPGTVESHLARSIRDRKKIVVAREGKHAVTHYSVLERLPLATWTELRLETGRTHQIRVHMQSIGHPVFGDQTYGGRGSRLAGLNREETQLAMSLLERLPRQALHAKTLGFIHPKTSEFMEFDSPIPVDMLDVLTRLREEKARRKAIIEG